jgi:acetoin utilization deacetylase AcuC-like enzyme
MGTSHPECPARLVAIEDQLVASGLNDYLLHVEAPLVTRVQLERVHDAGYIAMIEAGGAGAGTVQLDSDTTLGPETLPAALRAAGAGVLAADMVISGAAHTAFCNVRPPGHHAERQRAMGFCFFNNIAVAAAHAMDHHGLRRVAIADFDVHHGNGTENIFEADERVLMVSTFQHPFYPFSGHEPRTPRMVNIPLAAYTGSKEFRDAVQEHWLPALEQFKPEMIFVSAGFDAHRDDDMGMLRLNESDYAWVAQQLKAVADIHAQGRMVSMLEGGYEPHALGRSVVAYLKAFIGT